MSLYNQLFDENPDANILIGFLGLNKEIFERYRNIYLNAAGDKIIVYTRCGGDNRKEYNRVFEMMKKHPNYICDYDDTFDNTYAYIEFSVPDKYKDTAQHMKPDKDPLSVYEQFDEHIRKSNENPNGPEAQKNQIIMEQIAKAINEAIKNGSTGINFIEL